MLTISETETKTQLLQAPIPHIDTIPGILPENFSLKAVGVKNPAEFANYRTCMYCGAPVLITFPSCSHCNMSKPYLEMCQTNQKQPGKPEWKTDNHKLTINQGDVPGYDDASEVVINESCAGGIYRSAKVDLGNGASIVSANAIEINFAENAKAQEITARHITLGANVKVGTVTVYDHGTLTIDESTQISELFVGKNVKIEVKGIIKPALLQTLRDKFRPINPGTRTEIACQIPPGMVKRLQKGA